MSVCWQRTERGRQGGREGEGERERDQRGNGDVRFSVLVFKSLTSYQRNKHFHYLATHYLLGKVEGLGYSLSHNRRKLGVAA